MRYVSFLVQDRSGNVQPGVSVSVFVTQTTTLATLYEQDGVTSLSNPFFSDVNGYASFAAPDGVYDATGILPDSTTFTRDAIPVFDVAALAATATTAATSATGSATSASSSATSALSSANAAATSAGNAAISAASAQVGTPNRSSVRLVSGAVVAGNFVPAPLPANTYNNGSGGVGATWTMTSVGVLTLDGKAVALGDSVVIPGEATAANNGIATCTTAGTVSVAAVLTRRSPENMIPGLGSACVLVTDGNTLSGYSFYVVQTAAGISAIGTTAITIVPSSSSASLSGEVVARNQAIAVSAASFAQPPQVINIFDKNRITTGMVVNTNGTLGTNASYFASARIAVTPGATYTFNLSCSQLAYFDQNGTFVSYVAGVATNTPFTVPAGCFTLQFSQTIASGSTNQELVPGSVLPTTYMAFGWVDAFASNGMSLDSARLTAKLISPLLPFNLYDLTKATNGFALNTASGLPNVTNSLYSVSDFILLDPSNNIMTNGAVVGYYDVFQNFLSSTTVGAATPFARPAGAYWFRFQLLITNQATHQFSWGSTLPSPYTSFGYPTFTTMNLTALQQARAAVTDMRADDANILNPSKIVYNKSISAVNGAISTTSGFSLSGKFEVNPGDYIACSVNFSSLVFYDITGNTYVSSPSAASITASITGNVMTVSAVGSGVVQVGQRLNGATSVTNVLQQLSGTTGAAGTYLMDVAQTFASGTLTATQGTCSANTWVPVPATCYFAQFNRPNLTDLPACTVRQGRTAIVNRSQFTAQIAGTVLTISAVASGQVLIGDSISGPGVTPGTTISSLGTGTGGTGTYNISVPSTVSTDTTMYGGVSSLVAGKSYGGGGAVYANAGKRIGFFGNSQTNNNNYQGTVIQQTGLIEVFNDGNPGYDIAALATKITSGANPYNPSGVNQLANIDILFFQEGHNEWGGAARPLGALGDAATVNSTYGQMQKLLNGIYALNANLLVVFAGPSYRGACTISSVVYTADTTPNAQGLTGKNIDDAMRAFAQANAIPYVELRNDSNINSANVYLWTIEGLHWNSSGGGIRVGRVIAGTLNNQT